MKILGLLLLVLSLPSWGTGNHGTHDSATATHATGPHGGRLLTEGDFSLEISIYESGIPPEMRVYSYDNDERIAPDEVALTVTLHRLGDQQDAISFTPEADYLLGEQIISEPHSYEVVVEARYNGRDYQWRYDSFEGRTRLNARVVERSGIRTQTIGSQPITSDNRLFGVIEVPEDQIFRVHAPYAGTVTAVEVNTGDRVTEGQTLLSVKNPQTLQSYAVKSPADGEVLSRSVTVGEHTEGNRLVEVAGLSQVWVALSMFPHDIEKLRTGMPVTVFDLHGHERASGELTYISPNMTGGHIARARAVIDNPDGYWRPGMHIKAAVTVSASSVPVAVQRNAIQTLHGQSVVFVREGEIFEARPVVLGRQGRDYVEVTEGVAAGMEYVTENSYLLKADILKSGASHAH